MNFVAGRVFEIERHEYKVLKSLGEGGFAYVYAGKDETGRSVAIKAISLHQDEFLLFFWFVEFVNRIVNFFSVALISLKVINANSRDKLAAAKAEIKLMRSLPRNKHLVTLVAGAARQEQSGKAEVVLVLELCRSSASGLFICLYFVLFFRLLT